jgi:hypothetical protein
MATTRVKFLRGTSLGNGSDAAPGDVVELDTGLVAVFAQQGRVVVLEATEPAPVDEATADSKPARKAKK